METASLGPTNKSEQSLDHHSIAKSIIREKLFNVQTARFQQIISSDSLFPINHVYNFGAYSKM